MSLSKKMGACLLIAVFVVMSLQYVKAEIVVEKPSPSIGDYWEYSYSTDVMNGNQKFSLTSIQDISQAGNTYNVYVMTLTGSGTYDDTVNKGTYTFAGSYYFSTSDFSRVKIMWTTEMTIPTGIYKDIIQQCTFIYKPPVKEYDFPLKAGKTWSVSSIEQENCQETLDGSPQTPVVQDNTVSYTMSAPSSGKKSVTAGTFDAIYTKTSETTPMEQWISSDVGFILLEQHGTDYKLELIKYHYTSPAAAAAGMSMMIIVIVAVIVVVVVVVLVVVMLMMKKKKAAAAAAIMPPVQPGVAPVATTTAYAQPAPAPVYTQPAPAAQPAPAYPLPPQQAPPPAQAPQPQYAPPPPQQPQYAAPPQAPAPPPAAPAPPPSPPPAQPAPSALCPTCRSPLRIIPEYNKWYCDRCRRYP